MTPSALKAHSISFLVPLLFFLLAGPTVYATCDTNDSLWLTLRPCNITLPNGQGTVYSWGAEVTVDNGHDGAVSTNVCVCPGTVLNTTLLMAPSICQGPSQLTAGGVQMTAAQCVSRRGGFVDDAALSPATPAELTAQQGLNPDWVMLNGPGSLNAAVDARLRLRGGAENNVVMTEVLVRAGQNSTANHLALGDRSVLLDALVAKGRIDFRSFGLDAGSTSTAHPRDGSLVLGGYDAAAVAGGGFTEYAMDAYPQLLNNRLCPLQVTIQSLTLRVPGRPPRVLVDNTWSLQACIEPYDNLFRFPWNNLVGPLVSSVLGANTTSGSGSSSGSSGGSGDGTLPLPADPNLWVNEPGLAFPAKSTVGFNGSLIFTLNNNFTVEIPTHEILRPLRGLAADGSVAVNDSIHELQVYSDPVEPLNAAVLGKAFLSQVYLYAEYDRRVFSLAALDTTRSGSSPVVLSDADGQQAACGSDSSSFVSSGSLRTLSIVLIVVGVVIVIVVATLIWLVRGQQRRQAAGRESIHRRGAFAWLPWRRRLDPASSSNGPKVAEKQRRSTLLSNGDSGIEGYPVAPEVVAPGHSQRRSSSPRLQPPLLSRNSSRVVVPHGDAHHHHHHYTAPGAPSLPSEADGTTRDELDAGQQPQSSPPPPPPPPPQVRAPRDRHRPSIVSAASAELEGSGAGVGSASAPAAAAASGSGAAGSSSAGAAGAAAVSPSSPSAPSPRQYEHHHPKEEWEIGIGGGMA